jgi:hypothetical protein
MNTSTNNFFPIYDAFLDLSHPLASTNSNVNFKRIIIAPPKDAFHLSKNVGVELSTEQGLHRLASFCFPDFNGGFNNGEL